MAPSLARQSYYFVNDEDVLRKKSFLKDVNFSCFMAFLISMLKFQVVC